MCIYTRDICTYSYLRMYILCKCIMCRCSLMSLCVYLWKCNVDDYFAYVRVVYMYLPFFFVFVK